jgi:predicted amidohydrolase YtcJ
VRYTIGSAFLVLSIFPSLAMAQEMADTIYSGGPILTIDDSAPTAEAVAVKDGRIIAVGSLADVQRHKGDETKILDLGGRAMLPGFVDSHGHVVMGGLQALSANLLAPPDGEVKDIASLQQTLRDWVEENKEAVDKVKLIVGFGYDNAQLGRVASPDSPGAGRGVVRHPYNHRSPVRTSGCSEFQGA